MATYPIPELLSMWENGRLTSDQAIGHILQTITALSQRLADTEQPHPQVTRSRARRSEQPQPETAAPAHSRRSKAGARTRSV